MNTTTKEPTIAEKIQIPAEELSEAIVTISSGMKALANSRLRMDTIVTLLHDYSKISKRDIRSVLSGLESLESFCLKPIKK